MTEGWLEMKRDRGVEKPSKKRVWVPHDPSPQ